MQPPRQKLASQKVNIKSDAPVPAAPAKPLVKKVGLPKKRFSMKTVFTVLLIIIAGIGSGYGLNYLNSGVAVFKSSEEVSEDGVKVGDVIGIKDEKTFRDNATGVLEVGGIDGEGSHHLLREGGPDQTAYLTSSVVDLELFVGHKIEVWGETFDAQKAGWLMDVGRVKVLELNAEKPFEEIED